MIVNNKICVFDFETDGKNPEVCSPVQLAAVIVDPLKLEIVPDSEFNVTIKPEKLENDPSYSYKTPDDGDILAWHGKVRGCSEQEILKSWIAATPQKQAWKMFSDYLNLYHSRSARKSKFSAPIAAGYNIYRFDLVISKRLCGKYNMLDKDNEPELFAPRDVLDIMNLIYPWMMNIEEVKSISLDNIRKYLGISGDNAHDALKDVKDCAEILIRFLKLYKSLTPKISFKDSFKYGI